MKLNLGSGHINMDGYVNVDICDNADMKCDLFQFPWPWADGSVDEVHMSHFMEHFHDPVIAMREVIRVLKTGGRIVIIVPHARSVFAYMPGWHHTQWGVTGFQELGCRMENGKWVIDVKTVSTRLLFPNWAKKTFPKIGWMFPLMQWLANIRPLYWEFFGLPCVEVEWIAVKK